MFGCGVTMRSRFRPAVRRALSTFVVLMLAFVCRAGASSAILLLEEPYGKLGFFTATGHAAVYLSGVCADSPLVLRHCTPGETGVVLSRYDGVGGRDWVAIPLIPYLYAVESAEDVPLFADPKMVAFLRDRYRRKYLEDVAPDSKKGDAPGGNWYELVGSSYDRAIYGFEIETTAEQDEALIRKYNSSPNRSHFRTVSSNCADFAKDIINFYYPKALHRSLIADVGITTPKQMAKRMVKFSARHTELHFSRLVIPQVPGSMPRSTAVHGVVESFFKSKKYIVPSVFVSPIFAGCVAAVYVGSGTGRFDPARDALVFTAAGEPEPPLNREDRRAYRKELEHLLAAQTGTSSGQVDKTWGRLQAKAHTAFDERGLPVLRVQVGPQLVSIGASAENVLSSGAPPELIRQLLEARLQAELRRKSSSSIPASELTRDWGLLEQALEEEAATASRSGQLTARRSGRTPEASNFPRQTGNLR
jgi:hypothetical protein